jgi:hypothetical protein
LFGCEPVLTGRLDLLFKLFLRKFQLQRARGVSCRLWHFMQPVEAVCSQPSSNTRLFFTGASRILQCAKDRAARLADIGLQTSETAIQKPKMEDGWEQSASTGDYFRRCRILLGGFD